MTNVAINTEQAKGQLARNPSASEAQQLQYVISEASKALNLTERFVPR